MDRSIAQGRTRDARPDPLAEATLDRRLSIVAGCLVVVAMLVLYTYSNPYRWNLYDHFVWQADAWLHGETAIRYPVISSDGIGAENYFFQDVMPVEGPNGSETGRAIIPFPPLPALVILPFVALWGLATDSQQIAAIIGALDVGIAFWMLGRVRIRPSVRMAATLFLAVGTVLWYAAMLGTTWYLAHVVAMGLTLAAIGVALGGDEVAIAGALDGDDEWYPDPEGSVADGLAAVLHRPWTLIDRRQFLAGFLLGLAGTARLTVIFGAPLLLLVGSGGSWRRRVVSTGAGMALPLLGLLAYNLVSTGHLFNPAYDHLYQLEAGFYTFLNYNQDWAIEDPRYIPQNLGIALFGLPKILPACEAGGARGLFDPACPWIVPRDVGMSVLLTSPAWLLALPALREYGRSRLVTGAAVAVAAIAFVNLMHFSQGWVQFGYRFSNDFAPFGLVLVALGMERLGGLSLRALALIAGSVVINWWGVVWGITLGW